MELCQAKEMVQSLLSDNEMSISTLGLSGDDVAETLYNALMDETVLADRLAQALHYCEVLLYHQVQPSDEGLKSIQEVLNDHEKVRLKFKKDEMKNYKNYTLKQSGGAVDPRIYGHGYYRVEPVRNIDKEIRLLQSLSDVLELIRGEEWANNETIYNAEQLVLMYNQDRQEN